MLIYVLAPDDDALQAARERYTDPIFKPILLPQTPYLESYMYTDYLMAHEDEWRDEDWVGCVAHSAHTKQPRIFEIEQMMREAATQHSEFCAFMYRGDPLVETAEKWHPGFTECWHKAWDAVGWMTNPTLKTLVTHDSCAAAFYCNYWATTPALMRAYCQLFKKLKDAIERDPDLKAIMYKDSGYKKRGTSIAKISDDKCMALWKVPYYPMLPFVMERMPCVFFPAHCKLTLLR